jgi:ubiquinone/menaquinone biosynthesis C-methylase UbiE
MSAETESSWSSYWGQGHVSAVASQRNYEGETANYWKTQFKHLNQGDQVLDVCSGNGAVAILAQEYSERFELNLRVTAVDAANISPAQITERLPYLAACIRAIRFKSNMPIENLDDEAESYNLITSQYGIEYTDLKESAQQITRILKPGGHFSLICHAPDSVLVKVAEKYLEDFDAVVESGLIALRDKLEKRDYFRRVFNKELDSALNALYNDERSKGSPLITQVGTTFEPFCKLTLDRYLAGLKQFKSLCNSLLGFKSRQEELLRVNALLKQSPPWHNIFSHQGLNLAESGSIIEEIEEFHVGDYYCFEKLI